MVKGNSITSKGFFMKYSVYLSALSLLWFTTSMPADIAILLKPNQAFIRQIQQIADPGSPFSDHIVNDPHITLGFIHVNAPIHKKDLLALATDAAYFTETRLMLNSLLFPMFEAQVIERNGKMFTVLFSTEEIDQRLALLRKELAAYLFDQYPRYFDNKFTVIQRQHAEPHITLFKSAIPKDALKRIVDFINQQKIQLRNIPIHAADATVIEKN